MLPFVRDMSSIGFRKSSFAYQSRWEVISYGDVGLKVAYNGMRGSYVHMEEPYVGPPRQTSVSLTMLFFYPRLC